MDAVNKDVSKALTSAVESVIAPPEPVPQTAAESLKKTKKPKPVKHLVTARAAKAAKPKPTAADLEFDTDEETEVVAPQEAEDAGAAASVPAAAELPQSRHSAAILGLAREVAGMTDEQAEQYEPGELGAYVHGLVRQLKENVSRGQPANANGFRDPVAEPAPVAEVDEFSELGLDPDNFTTDHQVALRRMVQNERATKKEMAELKKQLAAVAQQNQTREQQAQFAAIDAAFDATKNPTVFGTGPHYTIKPEQMDLRNAVIDSLNKRPIPGIPFAAAVQRRAAQLFPKPATAPGYVEPTARVEAVNDEDTKLEADPLEARKKKWVEEGPVATPTRRAGHKERGTVANVKKMFVDNARAQGFLGVTEADNEDFI